MFEAKVDIAKGCLREECHFKMFAMAETCPNVFMQAMQPLFLIWEMNRIVTVFFTHHVYSLFYMSMNLSTTHVPQLSGFIPMCF